MATQITNYQCPACTGPLHYAGESGKLECEYCGSSFSVEEIEDLYREKDQVAESNWDTASLNSDWGEDGEGMKAYNCPSCGAELICEANTAATACPYCGNPSVVPGQFSGTLKPDYVVPFVLEKEKAVEALKAHYKGKFLLPKTFSDQNQIEKIQGVYVPFWLFDAVAEGSAVFAATKTSHYIQGDYRITKTSHYVAQRSGSMAFEKIPADASSKMPDDYMDSIEPFDYSKMQPFSMAYLPGYLADKYDVSVDECRTRADERCIRTLKDSLRDTVRGYDSVTERNANIHLSRGKVHYALMPVWLLSTRWQGKNFLFAVNGQTGKLVGNLPVDKGKFWGLFAALTLALGSIASVVISLLG